MLLKQAKYVPILSLKPAEMAALEELFDKEKDLILPLIPLKRWANSKSFEKSLDRVVKAIGQRFWIADLDPEFVASLSDKIAEGNKQDVFFECQKLSSSENGYQNWVDFISQYEHLIPVLQVNDIEQLDAQIEHFIALERPIVARLQMSGPYAISVDDFNKIIRILKSKTKIEQLFIILDYNDLERLNLLEYYKYSHLINGLDKLFPKAFFSVSGTSFPYSFAGSYRGEIPIYERQIFNKVVNDCPNINLIYSDRGSARALSMNGGSGVPPPRIDYPIKNDWRFIRKEFNGIDEKEDLYQDAAVEMMKSDYWLKDLPAWGRQMIEKTSLGDPYGITSAYRATAVRINLHLYHQLHYFESLAEVDVEEDWED